MSTLDNVYSNYNRPRINQQWTCAICDKVYVVATMARLCEEKHLDTER
jgi:hypothetical protein